MLFESLFRVPEFTETDRARMMRIERKLDLIIQHLGIQVPDAAAGSGLSPEVRRLADAGQKLQAIKVHRDETGAGLAEAKQAVETYLGRK
jgi:hypothetical protein